MCKDLESIDIFNFPGELIHQVVANGEPRSTPAEELSEGNEEKKRSKDTENTNDIVSIEDDEEDKQPKPKPKKKRDSGYTKSLQEAMANLKMTDNEKQRRVSLIQCTLVTQA